MYGSTEPHPTSARPGHHDAHVDLSAFFVEFSRRTTREVRVVTSRARERPKRVPRAAEITLAAEIALAENPSDYSCTNALGYAVASV